MQKLNAFYMKLIYRSAFCFKFLILLFFMCLSSLIPAQMKSTETAPNQAEFDSLYFVVLTNSKDIYKHGKYMFSFSQTDLQRARSSIIMGDGLYKQGNYLEAVKVLEDGDKYAIKAGNDYWRMYIANLLIRTYKYAGLDNKAEEYFELLKVIKLEDESDRLVFLMQCRAQMYEIDKDYCNGSKYRENSLDAFITQFKHEPLDVSKNFIIPGRVITFYDQMKCGKYDKAKQNLKIIDELINKTKYEYGFNFTSHYFVGKALLLAQENGSTSLQKEYYSKAYHYAVKTDQHNIIKTIVEDVLASNLFSKEEEKEFYAKLVELGDSKIKQQGKLVNQIISEKDKQISRKENYQNFFLGLSILAGILALGSVIFLRYRNRKNSDAFQRIIQDLQQPRVEQTNAVQNENRERILSEEVEQQLLKSLVQFEEKERYLNKDISASLLASQLKTTTRNLTYVLKNHRNLDFNNYINELRINWIVKQLKENTILRNYKISALAELCGYNSHSQFTVVFKNRKGISPSQYLAFLEKKHL